MAALKQDRRSRLVKLRELEILVRHLNERYQGFGILRATDLAYEAVGFAAIHLRRRV
jgi:hypothetical protein